jgi:holo-[acyl-carrier protein] synthase
LYDRLFTSGEQEYAARQARPGIHLAARFCAKEAVAKALGLKAWGFLEVEVVGGGDGPPQVALSGLVRERADELDAVPMISLTHTHSNAAAVAIFTR